MKTVALLEFAWVGHHPGYFRLYVRSLLAAGCRVVAFCPRPEEVTARETAACAEGRLEAHVISDELQTRRWQRKVPPLSTRYRFRQSARRLAAWEAQAGRRIDLVFFACLYDGAAPWGGVDAIFPYRWTGLLLDSACIRLNGSLRRLRRTRGFDPLAVFRARGCVSLGTLDPFIREELSRRTGRPVETLPEVIDDALPAGDGPPLAGALRTQAAGRAVVGCFGQIARRKGALDFLRLAEACREEPWFFVWAGQLEEKTFTEAERRLIQEHSEAGGANCLFAVGRVADEADFNALVTVCRALCLRYHGHVGSSNMISKAAAFDKPVLVSDGYCMADQTRRYDLGLCVPEGDTAEARRALGRLLAPDPGLPPARFAEYRAEHSPARFAEAVRRMVAHAGTLA